MKSCGLHPTVIVISDDVHNERMSSVMTQMKSAPDEKIDKIQKWLLEREMHTYAKSDVIVAVSKEDGAAFATLASSYEHPTHDHDQSATSTRIVVAPYTAQATTNPIHPFREREDQLLIVGNPHSIVLLSMRWFLTEVCPSLRAMKSNLRFKIVGNEWKQKMKTLLSHTDQSGSPSSDTVSLSHFKDDDWATSALISLTLLSRKISITNSFKRARYF